MGTEGQPAPEKSPDQYFRYLASLGMTKHIGAMQATSELIERCHIGPDSYVLDVGCGVGITPCYLAKTYNCRVMGIDILEEMIAQSRRRAKRMGVEDRVEFQVADARDLPFDDGTFDVVLGESINTFFADKVKAIRGYVRVLKPGGYVGLTEMTWLQPPTPERAAYYKRVVYADSLEKDGWRQLLEEAGLQDVVANAYHIDVSQEAKGRLQRYGCSGMIGVLFRTVASIIRNPSSREFLKDVTSSVPQDMMADMGYGVFVGKKP